MEYTVGIASGVPVTFISVGDDNTDGALLGLMDVINFLLAQAAPPQVLTTSFGQNENIVLNAMAQCVRSSHCSEIF